MALFSGSGAPVGRGSATTVAPRSRAAAAPPVGVTTVIAFTATTSRAAVMVSISIARTTRSRWAGETAPPTGSWRVRRLTAMIVRHRPPRPWPSSCQRRA